MNRSKRSLNHGLKVATLDTSSSDLFYDRFFLSADIRTDRSLVCTNDRTKVPPSPELLAREMCPMTTAGSSNMNGRLALDVPNNRDTAYFGGMDTNM